ncbi:MAG: hypothetical protein AMJ64_12045 [Betaproteobacteria bacterium SG8_39]|nr:MAG: hypothetical protein AMJ64_12045 [Betaproteobacteria bacterium SG8_39]
MATSAQDRPESLLVLVGITATGRSRYRVARFFKQHGTYTVWVPAIPYWRGLRSCTRWLERFLAQTVRLQEGEPIHVLAYIAGGALLRGLAAADRLPPLARVLWVRGPVQERVAAKVVARYGRLLGWLLGGRSMLDLADGWPRSLPFPHSAGEQGLMIEEGVSWLARRLGLGPDDVPPEGWDPAQLLPGAHAVRRAPESHDAVYSSPALLASALHFFQHGRFAARQR